MKKSVRVAIISDTHAWLHPQIAQLIRECDIAIHAGDICNADILAAMQPRTGQVIAVRGNNDHPDLWPSQQTGVVEKLAQTARLDVPGGVIKIEHGHLHDIRCPKHEDLRKAHPEARMVVYGHTHRKVIDDFLQPWVVNPGAAGKTRNRGGASCLVLNASETMWKLDSYRYLDEYADSMATTANAA